MQSADYHQLLVQLGKEISEQIREQQLSMGENHHSAGSHWILLCLLLVRVKRIVWLWLCL